MTRRLFIAIDVPESVRDRLARMISVRPEGVRPVRHSHMHLTIHFLGSVDEPAVTELVTALAAIHRPAFAIDIAGGGCFPSLRRPTVLWAGIVPDDALAGLHAAIGDLLRERGLPVESRPFVPHVTLARLSPRVPRSWVEEFLRRSRDLEIQAIPVTAFTLFESQHTRDGSEHIPRATYALDDAAGASR